MRVNEIFYSLQGEGAYAGTPAVFIRFSGCNRRCAFCDTDFAAFTEMSPQEIVEEVLKYPAEHVVITGGEPALQLNDELIDLLHDHGREVHVETNGSLPLPESVDWVTCSPKDPPLEIGHVDELKLVYTGQSEQEIEGLYKEFLGHGARVFKLQPCSGKNTEATMAYCLEHPHWGLSMQLHKFLGIR